MTPKLPADVAEKYELVGWTGGQVQHFGKHGVIDITKLSLAHADILVKRGFSKLRAKTTTAKAAKADAPAEK